MTYKNLNAILGFLLFCTGCDASLLTPTVSAPEFVTATLPVTATAISFSTEIPITISEATMAPTNAPVNGTTTSEVNVRADTSTASPSLGTVPAFSAIQVSGKDPSGIWYQIVFNNGTGWVRADFVQLADATVSISVVVPEMPSDAVGRGVVLRGVNVRSEPDQDVNSLGLLNQNDVISIFGKDSSGEWVQIEFPPAVDGKGWVAAEFLEIENIASIPTLNQDRKATPTVAEAFSAPQPNPPQQSSFLNDTDSAEAPVATFVLSQAGTRSAQFQGEIASPNGDSEDWVRFSNETNNVVIQVLCNDSNIQVELLHENVISDSQIECGKSQLIRVNPWQEYLLKFTSKSSGKPINDKYELHIKISK